MFNFDSLNININLPATYGYQGQEPMKPSPIQMPGSPLSLILNRKPSQTGSSFSLLSPYMYDSTPGNPLGSPRKPLSSPTSLKVASMATHFQGNLLNPTPQPLQMAFFPPNGQNFGMPNELSSIPQSFPQTMNAVPANANSGSEPTMVIEQSQPMDSTEANAKTEEGETEKPKGKRKISKQQSKTSKSSAKKTAGAYKSSKRQKLEQEQEAAVDAEEAARQKREKRLLQNRRAAQVSRDRKKAYLAELEKRVADLAAHNARLQTQIRSLGFNPVA